MLLNATTSAFKTACKKIAKWKKANYFSRYLTPSPTGPIPFYPLPITRKNLIPTRRTFKIPFTNSKKLPLSNRNNRETTNQNEIIQTTTLLKHRGQNDLVVTVEPFCPDCVRKFWKLTCSYLHILDLVDFKRKTRLKFVTKSFWFLFFS